MATRRFSSGPRLLLSGLAATVLLACAAGAADQAGEDRAPSAPVRFEVDRRPVLMVRVWNGSYAPDNPLGLSPGFRGDDAGERIAESLTRLYAQGWRRFMLQTPAGGPKDAVLSDTLGEWWSRSQRWRDTMNRSLRAWKSDHPDATLGVYMGLRLRNGAFPDERVLERALGPWLELGITEFGFDATSPDEAHEAYLLAQAWLRERGARAIMEAYPVDRANGVVEPDWLERTPMFAIERFHEMVDPKRRWAFDPESTEVLIGVGRGGGPTLKDARDYVRRGFVLLVYSIHENDRFNALRAATER